MTYANFLKITLGLQKTGRDLSKLYDMKVDLLDLIDPYHEIINVALSEIYTEEGCDWLNWFMYENDFGEKDWSTTPTYILIDGKMVLDTPDIESPYGARDKDGNPICYSFESTYEFLKQYKKLKNHK